jgi:hypothetical protein
MMKRILVIAAMGTAAVFAADPQVISLVDLNKETVEDFTEGKLPNIIISCPEGTILPLTFSLKGEFLALDSQEEFPAHVKIIKTCLVKCVEETFLFSLDGKKWKDFSKFFTGNVGVGFYATDKGPYLGVDCELKHRR